MKKTLLILLSLAAFAAACDRKLTYSQIPYMEVYIDPFYVYPDGSYKDLFFVPDSIENVEPKTKPYMNEKYIFHSALDSNVVVFVGLDAMFLFRICEEKLECNEQIRVHSQTEVFKSEFMRMQKAGVYPADEAYADSVSDHIVSKLKELEGSGGDSIMWYVVYNDQMAPCNSSSYTFRDYATTSLCIDYPETFVADVEACNDWLDSLSAIREQGSGGVMPASGVRMLGRNTMLAYGFGSGSEASLVSPLGVVIARYRMEGPLATLRADVPAGNYQLVVRNRSGVSTFGVRIK